jgi:hypothetical protein
MADGSQSGDDTRASPATVAVYEAAFDSYRSADRMVVREMYLGIFVISVLTTVINRAEFSVGVYWLTVLLGFFTLSILYYSSWTLETVKHVSSEKMKEIERDHFDSDAPNWQTEMDEMITHTAESGDSLGWFRTLPQDSLPNRIVPTGWVGIQLVLLVVWAIYSILLI